MDSFTTILAFVHIIIAVVLVFFVLMQDSKGGAMGALGGGGGGGNSSLFGSSGAASFLVKATRWTAIFFAATCIGLTYYTSHPSKSVVDDYVPAAGSGAIEALPTVPSEGAPAADKAIDPVNSEPKKK